MSKSIRLDANVVAGIKRQADRWGMTWSDAVAMALYLSHDSIHGNAHIDKMNKVRVWLPPIQPETPK